jgi:tight adherence protein C
MDSLFSNESFPLFVSTLAFLVTCLLCIGVFQFVRASAQRRQFLKRIHDEDEGWDRGQDDVLSMGTKGHGPMRRFLGKVGKRFFPDQTSETSEIKMKFLKAGLRRGNVAAVFWGTKILLAFLFPFGFLAMKLVWLRLMTPSSAMMACVVLALLGFYLPELWLRIRTGARKERIMKGMPDALDLLVVCVEAGMGMDAAINRVAEDLKLSNPVLSDELQLMNLELRAGKPRQDALKDLAARTDIEDMSNLVTLLIQTDRFGTSVSQALRVYADAFRTTRYQRAEEIAAKIPVKLLFPLIFFVFPGLFVAIMGPAAIRIYHTFMH